MRRLTSKERLVRQALGQEVDRIPSLGGWIGGARNLAMLAEISLEEYLADPSRGVIEAHRRLGVDGMVSPAVPTSAEQIRLGMRYNGADCMAQDPLARPPNRQHPADRGFLGSDAPVIILLFGPSAAGKSTVARMMAGRMSRCAHIEVDVMRYRVVGGLVAYSAGTPPWQAPEEYARHCRLGVENAVSLARNLARHGFSSVVEGLEDDCRPGSGWAQEALAGHPCLSVALVCGEPTMTQRRRQRGAGDELPPELLAEMRGYRENATLFDCTVHTSDGDAGGAAAAIMASLGLSTQTEA